MVTALYLAHLNPVTNAHVEIISDLKKMADSVKIMPVVFRNGDKEINSKSFPFNYETRKKMIESVFGDSVRVTEDYAFFAPFKNYMPPLLAPKSWKLRKQVLKGVKGEFFSYTGDKAEGYMLKIYRLKPKVGERKSLSASSVKEKLYEAALGGKTQWQEDVPDSVRKIIEENWETVNKFAQSNDQTTKIAGMKFPKEGWSKKDKE